MRQIIKYFIPQSVEFIVNMTLPEIVCVPLYQVLVYVEFARVILIAKPDFQIGIQAVCRLVDLGNISD